METERDRPKEYTEMGTVEILAELARETHAADLFMLRRLNAELTRRGWPYVNRGRLGHG